MNMPFHVIIVGASLAGCHLAKCLAQQGYLVALVERRADPDAYKVMCSHLLHPNVVHTLQDYHLYDSLVEQGGQATYLDIQVRGRHLFYPFNRQARMANIERRLLDPAVRHKAIEQPGVSFFPGAKVQELVYDAHQRVTGVEIQTQNAQTLTLHAPLTVGADGKGSAVAALAHLKMRTLENGRAAYFAYYEASQTATASQIWVIDKGRSYVGVFPNGPKVLVSCYLPKAHPAAAKGADIERHFDQMMATTLREQALGPRIGNVIAARQTSSQYRPKHRPGLTLVGDAYLSADPLTGVGCSWALRSAELLATSLGNINPGTQPSHLSAQQIDCALQQYRSRHAMHLWAPAYALAFVSTHGRLLTHPLLVKPASWLASKVAHRPLAAWVPASLPHDT
ncbi:MAG: NAD(P)/FAD-dependent oxidoreductase [Hahellaceae bacterium]|nr:NAD(P)/FAD-dependent oxidoreductase [Hahellaceae bacterium]